MPGGDLVTNRSDEVDSGFYSNLDAIQELFSLKDSNPESLIEEEKTFVLDHNGLLPSKILQTQGCADEASLFQAGTHKQLIEDRPGYAIAVASKSSSSLIDESWTSFALTFLDGVENVDYYIHRPDSGSGDWVQLDHGALIELERSEATIQAEQFIDVVLMT